MTALVVADLRSAGDRSWLLKEQMDTSEQRFQDAFQVARHGMALVGPDGRWLQVNPALCEMLGYSARELSEMDFQSVTHPDDLGANLSAFDRLLKGESAHHHSEKRYVHRDGRPVWVDLSVAPVLHADGSVAHFVCQIVDLTRRKQTEAQLLQAQKMESIGQLTGGIAHDFNNLLMIVQGNLELALRRVREDERLTALLRTAYEASERGAALTKQLLAFASRQPLMTKTFELSTALSGFESLIRHTIGDAVHLEFDCPPDIWAVRVDPDQLQTAVLNLVVNARDAMASHGTISIRARNQSVDASYAQMEGIDPGDYALLWVSDNGPGISKEFIDQVVEPFFTTKEPGKGTGLGLSMVYGFMKQSGGHLKIYSEAGTGTTVKLYLPSGPSVQTEEPVEAAPAPLLMAREGERVLVVDDQVNVLELAMGFLEELGYTAIGAESAKTALRRLEQDDRIDLVLSDVVMPGELDGLGLANVVADRFPTIPVLLMSGYPGHPSGKEGVRMHELLLKPFSLESLGKQVRSALDGRGAMD